MTEQQLEDVRKDNRHTERRLDDLEATLARVLNALTDAETREERMAAVEIADELPTIRVHRRLRA